MAKKLSKTVLKLLKRQLDGAKHLEEKYAEYISSDVKAYLKQAKTIKIRLQMQYAFIEDILMDFDVYNGYVEFKESNMKLGVKPFRAYNLNQIKNLEEMELENA